MKIFSFGDPFSTSDLNCFLSYVYDLNKSRISRIQKKKMGDNFLFIFLLIFFFFASVVKNGKKGFARIMSFLIVFYFSSCENMWGKNLDRNNFMLVSF